MTNLDKLSGGSAMRYINVASGTVTFVGSKCHTIVVNTDTVFTSIIDDNDNNLVTAYNLTGNTVSSGLIINISAEIPIKSITLTSGSVIAYLGAFRSL